MPKKAAWQSTKISVVNRAQATRTLDKPPVAPHVPAAALFWGFLKIGLSGFGGVLPFARRTLVERERWLTEHEFTEVVDRVPPPP